MKFLSRINRNYFTFFALSFLGVTILSYFVFQQITLKEAKENLLGKEYFIKKQIKESAILPNVYPIIQVEQIAEISLNKPIYKEIFIQNVLEDELEPYLEYTNQIEVEGLNYSVKIRTSIIEQEELLGILASSFFILLAVIFVVSFLITKKMNKSIWSGFEHNLKVIEEYSFSGGHQLLLQKSNIDEFDRLNKVINHFTEKIRSDYFALKEFSENASHEIQTPLSIVLLNLEEVLQLDINEDIFNKIASAIHAVKRLSLLNKSLILLTRIENNQFPNTVRISMNELVKQKIEEFTPLFDSKNLQIKLLFNENCYFDLNEELASILINNLFSNAVNHNIFGGKIQISMYKDKFVICNSGKTNSLTNKTIFNRFAKENSESFGLGLSLVKKICQVFKIDVRYSFDGDHCFIIRSKK